MILKVTQLKEGDVIKAVDGQYCILEIGYRGLMKKNAVMKLRNITNNRIVERTYSINDQLEIDLPGRKKCDFLYSDGDVYLFMDEDSAMIEISVDAIAPAMTNIVEADPVTILFCDKVPVWVKPFEEEKYPINCLDPRTDGGDFLDFILQLSRDERDRLAPSIEGRLQGSDYDIAVKIDNFYDEIRKGMAQEIHKKIKELGYIPEMWPSEANPFFYTEVGEKSFPFFYYSCHFSEHMNDSEIAWKLTEPKNYYMSDGSREDIELAERWNQAWQHSQIKYPGKRTSH